MPYRIPALLTFLLLISCTLSTQLPPTATPLPTPTPTPEPGWQQLQPGVEARTLTVPDTLMGQLWVLRIDPNRYTFRAHYQPGIARTLDDWQATLPDAAVIINANFFTADHTINGLLISDGIAYGEPYTDRGGTFGVGNGLPLLRANINPAYVPDASVTQAVQAFPMLVRDGQAAYTQPDNAARRTLIAQDTQGRILLMVTPLLGVPLDDLSDYLAHSELGITNALNLDGGGSTMIYAASPDTLQFRLPSLDPVPAVLAIYPR